MVPAAADVHPAGYPNVVAVESMGKKLEAATNGRPSKSRPSRVVRWWRKGNDRADPGGAINILRTSLGPVGTVVPEVNVFNPPFIFRSQEHARAVIDGPIGDELLAKVSASPAAGGHWLDGRRRPQPYTKSPCVPPPI